MLKVQEWLRSGNYPRELTEIFGIQVKVHQEFPYLYHFKYDQIDSSNFKAKEIVRECRGLILDSSKNWDVVCYPFRRFFNLGDTEADPVDWASARVQEKLDGSLACLWWHAGRWHVSTSGTPDASGMVQDFGFSFKELFWRVFDPSWVKLLSIEYTYIFELCTIYNRVVVPHQEPKVVLLGMRHTTHPDLPEIDMAAFRKITVGRFPFEIVKEFKIDGETTAAALVNSFEHMDPMVQEGYVVVDKNFNRLKIKHPGYVALHQLKSGMTEKGMIELVRTGEFEEVANYFPEYREKLYELSGKYKKLETDLLELYESIKDIVDQKDFAIKACTSKLSSALFQKRRHDYSIREYLKNMDIDRLQKVLNL